MKGNGRHHGPVSGQRIQLFAASRVPDLDQPICSSGHNTAAVRGEGGGGDDGAMAFQSAYFLTCVRIPELEHLVAAAGKHHLAVGAVECRRDGSMMAGECPHLLAGSS